MQKLEAGMADRRRPRLAMRAALTIALYAASTAASYIPARSMFLLERQNTCGISGHTQCAGSGVPKGFCCGASDQCMLLAGKTTVLCCPAGDSCNKIKPISCDVKLQNPATHPESVVKTTVFDVELATCDSGCCPFGYTCSDKICVADVDKDTPPGRAKSSSSPTPAPTTSGRTGGITPTSPNTRPATTTNPPSSSATGSIGDTFSTTGPGSPATAIPGGAENVGGPPPPPADSVATPSIIGGVVGALMFLIALAVGIFFCYRRKKKNAKAEAAAASPRGDGASSVMAYGNAISHPIPSETTSGAMRTDFNRKGSISSHSYGGASDHVPFAQAGATVGQNHHQYPPSPPGRNLTGRTTAAPQIPPLRGMRTSDGGKVGMRPGGYGGMTPPTTPPQRHISTESINVYVDGGPALLGKAAGSGGRRYSTETTFTTMMRQADLPDPRYGATFVPPAAFVTPDRRPQK
ncbi:hypothetical protein GGTG_01420 [Gaeumannomyces tritici R3-111a-1]|uniref:receptor protein-tyrosine kinase n=1 Tax=Gaeumannomyces tritici (strain R3-111a-1) TaxID=644352 RepID=J3NJI8_GAET3|nr:hypothetical protein GGTG_01420 [Gaeumannomyces tritici R3-111a-1]EJT81440.1 hypothetical protein GGTG_01420 [Gaeumannomyces tritici R3-111a-1]